MSPDNTTYLIGGRSFFRSYGKKANLALTVSDAVSIKTSEKLEYSRNLGFGKKNAVFFNDVGYIYHGNTVYQCLDEWIKIESSKFFPSESSLEYLNDDYFIFEEPKTTIYKRQGERLVQDRSIKLIVSIDDEDSYISRKRSKVLAKSFAQDIIWEFDFKKIIDGGSPDLFYLLPDGKNLLISFQSRVGGKGYVIVSVDTGEVSYQEDLDGSLHRNGIFIDNNYIYLVSDSIFKLEKNTGHLIEALNLSSELSGSSNSVVETDNAYVLMTRAKAKVVVVLKETFQVIQSIDLGGEQYYGVFLAANADTIAITFGSKDYPENHGPSFGLFLTEEQLIKGEIPDKVLEEPRFHITEESLGNEKFDLRITLDEDLDFADVIRHVSHGLYHAAYTYGEYVNRYDHGHKKDEQHPNFNGNITLDLSGVGYCFNPEEKAALDSVLEGAVIDFTGSGPKAGFLWVNVGTEDERNVQLFSVFPYEKAN